MSEGMSVGKRIFSEDGVPLLYDLTDTIEVIGILFCQSHKIDSKFRFCGFEISRKRTCLEERFKIAPKHNPEGIFLSNFRFEGDRSLGPEKG
jgi:hypothetical protein